MLPDAFFFAFLFVDIAVFSEIPKAMCDDVEDNDASLKDADTSFEDDFRMFSDDLRMFSDDVGMFSDDVGMFSRGDIVTVRCGAELVVVLGINPIVKESFLFRFGKLCTADEKRGFVRPEDEEVAFR